jgi:hypothetical protein
LPNEWHLLKQNGTVDLVIDKSRLPYMAQPLDTTIESAMFIAKTEDTPSITVDNTLINFSVEPSLKLLCVTVTSSFILIFHRDKIFPL